MQISLITEGAAKLQWKQQKQVNLDTARSGNSLRVKKKNQREGL